jgi:hypothetical protein
MDLREIEAIWDSTALRDDRVHAFGLQVAAAAVAPILEALIVMYHEGGHGRYCDQGSVSEAGLSGIEAGRVVLGRAGGDTIDGPNRQTWERATAVINRGPFYGPHNRLPHCPIWHTDAKGAPK